MPNTELTDEQRDAIHMRESSVALSAGAGCGKTHVLTHRYLSHLDPAGPDKSRPARLSQLIAITFTDAAAREMRSRIRRACYDRLREHELGRDAQAAWLRVLREIDTAQVSTIHSFCTSLVRNHATELGLDPTFGVLEQGEADVLQYEVIDDVLRAKLDARDDDALDLATAYSLATLKQQLALLIHKRHETAFKTWLLAAGESPASKVEQLLNVWQARHEREGFSNAVRGIAERAPIGRMSALLEAVEHAKPAFQDARRELLTLLPKLKAGNVTARELETICQNARVQTICKAGDWPGSEQFEDYKEVCTKLREAIKKHEPAVWDADAARDAAAFGLKLLRLAGDTAKEYERRKSARGKLDFDDQLALAHRLLHDPQYSKGSRARFGDLRLLLVDEFQDTDQLQAEIVEAVCGEGFDGGRLFFVGDFKQSIYRFRGAMPKVFHDFRQRIDERGRLPLNINFRSQPQILHFVNALFCDAFSSADARYEPLHAKRERTTKRACVEFLWTVDPEKYNRKIPGAAQEARRKEAQAIARRLTRLLDPNCEEKLVVDKQSGELRRARPGDVAILFRALSDVRLYEEALREQGLDYYLVGGHAFYAQQEIYDVLNLLRAVASAADEVSLAGVLRSPIFALEDETLFWLVDGGGGLNAGLLAEQLPRELEPAEQAKVAAAAATIRHLRSIKDSVPIARLLDEAFARTGYDAVLLAEFLGQRKLANLQKLCEQARTADSDGQLGLDGFITQLAEFIAQPPQEPLASTSPESADVIRLMTIHRAKGLEFPLVVVPDLDRPPHWVGPVVALDSDLGPLVNLPPDDEREKAPIGMNLFCAAQRLEECHERQRLLYVACTRARDYLILSSSLEDTNQLKSDWMELLAERYELADGKLRAALPEGFEAPQVYVTPQAEAADPPGRPRGADLLKLVARARELAVAEMPSIPREVEPIPVDRVARRQFSFSQLTGQLVQRGVPAEPLAGADSLEPIAAAFDPRGFGSLVHDVLARVDFGERSLAATIADWCEHLAPQYVVEDAQRAAESARELVERFVGSPRGRELAAAALEREIEFLLAWPPGQAGGNGRYLRGFIDCVYRDAAGKWRLLDYKTNDVAGAEVPAAAGQYEMQLYAYAIAAERTLGVPPVELVLHFLRPGVEHVLPWNDAVRQRAIATINEAIRQSDQIGLEIRAGFGYAMPVS
jgi:ATP-dependent helicase/nuclease subunit A